MSFDQTKKPTLCVDFDGVVHSYTSPWKGAAVISDPPVPGAIEWLLACIDYFEVVIYSSRSRETAGRSAMREYILAHAAPLQRPILERIEFASEKPAAFLTIDDRAVCFMGDFTKVSPRDLIAFTPWNRPPNGRIHEKVEALARELCQSEGASPDQLTFTVQPPMTKRGVFLVPRPDQLVPQWFHYIDLASAALSHVGDPAFAGESNAVR